MTENQGRGANGPRVTGTPKQTARELLIRALARVPVGSRPLIDAAFRRQRVELLDQFNAGIPKRLAEYVEEMTPELARAGCWMHLHVYWCMGADWPFEVDHGRIAAERRR